MNKKDRINLKPLLLAEFNTGISVYNKLAKNVEELKEYEDIFFKEIIVSNDTNKYFHDLCVNVLLERLKPILKENITNHIYKELIIHSIVNHFVSTDFYLKSDFKDSFKINQYFDNLNYAFFKTKDDSYILNKSKINFHYDSFFENEHISSFYLNVTLIANDILDKI